MTTTQGTGASDADSPFAVPFVGDSEMATRMAGFDWPASPLGPVEEWPASLRAAMDICLNSRYPMVIWWGPRLVLLYNDAWIPILGPEKHPALGKPGIDVWPETWHIIGMQLNSVLTTGRATFSDDQLLPAMRFGYLREAYFTYSYSPIRDESGAVQGVFTAVQETTERVLGERRMRTLRTLGDVTAAAAVRKDATFATVCETALEALAENRADIPFAVIFALEENGSTPRVVATMGVADPSLLAASMPDGALAAMKQATGQSSESIVLTAAPGPWGSSVQPGGSPAGDQPPTEMAVMPVQLGAPGIPAAVLVAGISPHRAVDDEFHGFFALVGTQISRALSDAQAYQAERRRAQALTELDRAKSAFFANVSHELRTPLTLIAGPTEDSLADSAEPLGPHQRARLEVIARNAGRLRRLVDDLLDFAQVEAGKRQPERELVDLSGTTEELVASFAPAIERAGLGLQVQIDPLPRPVAVDVGMWEKVVLNLLSNALKYTLDGHVGVELRADADRLLLSVSDTGIGIPKDEQPRLFERFHRIRGRAGRSHEGAGIGLALVAELVRLHEGTIRVESQEGAGSTFTVQLPYPAASAEPAGGPSSGSRPLVRYSTFADEALHWSQETDGAQSADTAPSTSSATVLVVEDNADMRTFISGVLRPHWRVLQAHDGRAALELARVHRPELVLTDVMMPHLDGFGLLAALRSDPRTASIAVVFLSARAGEEAAVEGLTAGADDYLPKPFSTVELLARVKSNLEMAGLRNRESEFRRTLVDSMQEGFFLTDNLGTIIEANSAFLDLLGYDASGLPYAWPQPWLPSPQSEPQLWAIHESAHREWLERGGGRYTLPMRHRDGRIVWLACSSADVSDPRSDRQLRVGTTRDVTAERLASQRDAALLSFGATLAATRSTADLLGVAAQQLASAFLAARVLIAQSAGAEAPYSVVSWPDLPVEPGRHRELLSAVNAARHQPATSVITTRTNVGTVLLAAPLGAMATSAVVMELPATRKPRPEDKDLFALLASRLAQELATAREYEQTRAVALTLQHALLGPARLPSGFAVRYTPAVEPIEVGGDWYDVIPLGAQSIGIVVGDCVGRGLPAAAVMGQLRSAAQALLLRTPDPAQALEGLDGFARRTPAAMCTTIFCAVIDQAAATLCYSSAGHPPPILTASDGEHQLLDKAQDLPLAARPINQARGKAVTTLFPGSTLLLYTDGLIERRGESLTNGINRLVAHLHECRRLHPEVVADEIVGALVPPGGYDDDVALLVYRHPPEPLQLRLPALPTSLATIRAELRAWLPWASVDPDVTQDMLLAVGEAASNSVEHGAAGAAQPVDIAITASVVDGVLHLTVVDNGRWRLPPTSPGNRGHGIGLINAMANSVEVRPGRHGTTVEIIKELNR